VCGGSIGRAACLWYFSDTFRSRRASYVRLKDLALRHDDSPTPYRLEDVQETLRFFVPAGRFV